MRKTAKRCAGLFLSLASCLAIGMAVGINGAHGEAAMVKAESTGAEVSVASNVTMDGLELTLIKNGVSQKATVASGKFTVAGAAANDVYAVSAKINGVMTSLGNLTIQESGTTFDPSSTIGTGNGGKLGLADSSYTYKFSGTASKYAFTLSEAHSGDAYFGAKISITEDAWNYTRGGVQSLFGISLTVGETDYFTDVWLSGDRAAIIANNKNYADFFVKNGTITDYGTALKGDGLWMIVQYDNANHAIKTYVGTSAENMTYLCDWATTGNDNGWDISSDLTVTGYSLGHHKEWGTSNVTAFDVSYSNVGFGSTLREALGLKDEAAAYEVSIPSNVNLNGVELTLKNGEETKTATVSNRKFTVNANVADTYKVSAKVNGIVTSLGSFIIKSSGNTFDPTETTGKGNDGSLDFANRKYVYKAGDRGKGYTFTMGEDVTGDAWVATKIQMPSVDDVVTNKSQGVFGIAMTVGNTTRRNHIRIFNGESFLVISDGGGFGVDTFSKNWTTYSAALKGDGLYFVSHYVSSTGHLETYLGTSIDNVTYYHDYGGSSDCGFDANGKLTSFGVGYFHDWGTAPAETTFSEVKYGKTLTEALGISEAVTLSSDSTYEHGKVDVSGKPYEDVILTFTPEDDYVLSSVKIDGEEKTITGNSLTLKGYQKQSVKVEATFSKNTLLESVDVTVPSSIDMDGVELTLKNGDVTKTATVSGSKFTLESVNVGDAYSVSAKINGIMTSLGTLNIKESGNSLDPTSIIGTGNGGTLDLKKGTYIQKYKKAADGFNFTLGEAHSGDAYFAAKISIPESALTAMTSGTESIFGIGLNVNGTSCWTDIWLSSLSSANSGRNSILAFNNENKSEIFAKDGALTDYGTALKDGGLWMVVQYDSASGKIKNYLGTSAENVTYICEWSSSSLGTGLSVTGYSIGRHKTDAWGKDYTCDITYSNLGFGSTLEEATGKATIVKTAKEYAVDFNSKIGCDASGAAAPTGWASVKTAWESLSEDAKAVLKNIDIEANDVDSDIKTCIERYEYIVKKWGASDSSTYNDFMGRNVKTGASLSKVFVLIDDKENALPIVAIVSLASVTALGGLALLKKKKENQSN